MMRIVLDSASLRDGAPSEISREDVLVAASEMPSVSDAPVYVAMTGHHELLVRPAEDIRIVVR